VAVSERAGDDPGDVRGTTWRDLEAAALAVTANVRHLAGGRPVVLATENTADCVAVLLGLLGAGVSTLCIEADSSYLADPRSAPGRLAVAGVVGPATGAAGTDRPRVAFADLITGTATLPAGPRGAGAADGAGAGGGEVLQLTSGSSGEPRIARHRPASCLQGGRLYRDLHGYTAQDRVLPPVPLAHSFGLVGGVMASLVSGAELALLGRFRLSTFHAALEDGATVLLGTPLLYRLLVTAPPARRPPRLRVALCSGGPLAPEVAEAARDVLGSTVRQVYGSTETGLIACQSERAQPWPADSVGAFAPQVAWRTVPVAGVPDGARLLVRTSTMFTGYLDPDGPPDGDGAATGGTPCEDVADYDTGDLVRVDGQGYLFVTARKDTFVNVGGRKVNPGRVERIIAEHPAVREVSVFGVDAGGEESLQAAVVLAGDAPVVDVLAFCRARLRPYEAPQRLHQVARLPRTGMGKVDRTALLTLLAARPASRPA
jgi:acyl-CoA synthetase (AMP-forming)/AMP-acid ligase II